MSEQTPAAVTKSLIQRLLRLQEFDRRLSQIRSDLADLPARKDRLRLRLQDREEAFRRAEAAWKEEALAVRNLEKEIESLRATLNRQLQQQFEVKSNEAYRTLLHEIEAIRASIRRMEDEALERMERTEQYQQALASTRRDLDDEARRVARECEELDGKGIALAAEAERLERERAEAAADLEPSRVLQYERIRRHVGDLAIVPVDHGTCAGCHMRLPPQTIHNVRRSDQIVACDFCGRMLYSPQES
ncbi:MAG: C4-type zinc ribbon domain-containing protein [Kiritimatiellae bacterium]|nr:C4-type zinc ribbon domain-containing protein [Kiritimatiellia bacterium]